MGAEIAFLLIVWVVKNAAADVLHAAKGTENPRYAARKRAKEAVGGRYGFGDWWADFKNDALQERTRLRREKAKRKGEDAGVHDPGHPVTAAVPGGAAGAEAGATGRAAPAAVNGTEPAPTPDGDCTHSDFSYGPSYTAPDGLTEQIKTCGRCGESWPTVVGYPDDEAPPTDPGDKPAAGTAEDAGPDATVIPINRSKPADQGRRGAPDPDTTEPDEPPSEGEPMPENEPSAEVVGLDQSIAYAERLAEVGHNHGLAGNEGYIGQLERSKVTGETLASGREMQEAFDNAADVATRHAELLKNQKAIQEQYDANTDAGDKEFQTAGR